MSKLIGLIGCGRWGKLILRDLRSLGCQVVAVARSQESQMRATDGGATWVKSIDALPTVDGIVVATPTPTHADVVRAVLDRGVPVFVEKPLVMREEDAREIRERAADRVFAMDKWRYHPGIRELGRIARSEELGRVVGLRTFRLGWGNPHDTVDAVWVLAPHDLSIGLEVLGGVLPPRWAVAELQNGEAVGLLGGCGDLPWHVLEVSSRRRETLRAAQLLCEEGIAELTGSYEKHVVITRGAAHRVKTPPEPEYRSLPDTMPLLAELRSFVEHLAGGAPPTSSAQEGAAIVSALIQLRTMAGLRAN